MRRRRRQAKIVPGKHASRRIDRFFPTDEMAGQAPAAQERARTGPAIARDRRPNGSTTVPSRQPRSFEESLALEHSPKQSQLRQRTGSGNGRPPARAKRKPCSGACRENRETGQPRRERQSFPAETRSVFRLLQELCDRKSWNRLYASNFSSATKSLPGAPKSPISGARPRRPCLASKKSFGQTAWFINNRHQYN